MRTVSCRLTAATPSLLLPQLLPLLLLLGVGALPSRMGGRRSSEQGHCMPSGCSVQSQVKNDVSLSRAQSLPTCHTHTSHMSHSHMSHSHMSHPISSICRTPFPPRRRFCVSLFTFCSSSQLFNIPSGSSQLTELERTLRRLSEGAALDSAISGASSHESWLGSFVAIEGVQALLDVLSLARGRATQGAEETTLQALRDQGGRVELLDLEVPATASSQLRQQPNEAQIPESVWPLLLQHNLYGLSGSLC